MFKTIALGTAGFVMAASAAFADSHIDPAIAGALKARQSHMELYQFNAGMLFAMASDKMPYDAEAASAAASNLVTLTKLDQSGYWPQGSDSEAVEGTRALPAMWENYPDVIAKATAFNEAVVAMDAVAGTDLASVKGAIGPIGAACTACHKAYRQPK